MRITNLKSTNMNRQSFGYNLTPRLISSLMSTPFNRTSSNYYLVDTLRHRGTDKIILDAVDSGEIRFIHPKLGKDFTAQGLSIFPINKMYRNLKKAEVKFVEEVLTESRKKGITEKTAHDLSFDMPELKRKINEIKNDLLIF